MLGNALEKGISKNGFGSRYFLKRGFIDCVWAAKADADENKNSLFDLLFIFLQREGRLVKTQKWNSKSLPKCGIARSF